MSNLLPTLGSICSDTMDPKHTLPAMMGAVRTYFGGDVGLLYAALCRIQFDGSERDNDAIDYLYAALDAKLNELCEHLPYVYFGTHPGDGACIGFWVDFEGIESDIKRGELLRVYNLHSIPADHRGLYVFITRNDAGTPCGWVMRDRDTPTADYLIWAV